MGDNSQDVDDTLTVEVDVRVSAAGPLADGGSAQIGVGLIYGGVPSFPNQTTLAVVEPLLAYTVVASAPSGDAGDVIIYTVDIEHPAGGAGTTLAGAHAVSFEFVLDAELGLNVASLANPGGNGSVGHVLNAAGDKVTGTASVLPEGGTLQFTFTATVENAATFNATLASLASPV